MFIFKGLRIKSLRYFVLIAAVIINITFLSNYKVYAYDNLKNVLIISSYHHGFAWSDDEYIGINKTLVNSGLNLNISIEYLDWKRYPYQSHIDNLYVDYKEKYSSKKIDTIITLDDAALIFALKNRSEIFSNAPIVFCGVNQLGVENILPVHNNVTGVVETVDPRGTLDVAYKLNPNLKKVFVLYDNSESGTSTGKLSIEAVKNLNKGIEAISITNLGKDKILDKVANLPNDSIVIMGSYQMDITGEPIDPQRFCKEVSEASPVPVYQTYDFTLNFGTIGGSLLSGIIHGTSCGELALRVLHGEDINSIPIQNTKQSKLILDYNQFKRFDINMNLIPKNSEIINKPFSFYETYKTLVISTCIVFTILISCIIILLFNIRLRKSAEKELKERNIELSELNDEITIAQENLIENNCKLIKNHEQLQKSEQRYILATEGSNDVIWDFDVENDYMFISDRWYEMLGYKKNELGKDFKSWRSIIHPEDEDKIAFDEIDLFKNTNQLFTTEFRLRCKSGDYKWMFLRGKVLFNKENSISRISGSMTDITKRKVYEETMYNMAYYDSLTKLPNRVLLEEKFNNCTDGTPSAIMFFDIDNFKNINDTFGHNFGDRILIKIGKILHSLSKENIIASRLGGDEFIIFYYGISSNHDIEEYLKIVVNSFDTPITIGNITINITFSIGISFYPKDGVTFNELLKNADTALYNAKNQGRKRYVYYSKKMNDELAFRLEMEKSLHKALDNKEFELYYQPQIDTFSGKIVGLEALVRWISPEKGIIFPSTFIELAEEIGLIVEIGKEVLRKACIFGSKLQNTMNLNICTSVNVSPIQLLQDDFVQSVIEEINSSGIRPENLGIEITETALIEHFNEATQKLKQLANLGVHIHLDDFGTGYSSLSYLKKLPINILKIDKSFIDDIIFEKPEESLTESIISLAHKMDLKVVAEGVEIEKQLEILKKYNCEMIQGYFISKPIPENQIIDLITSNLN